MLAYASYRQIMEDGPFFSILIPPPTIGLS